MMGVKMKSLEKTLTSNEVAKMVDKEHSKLMRDIRTYIGYLNEANLGSVEFFIESTYKDVKGENRPNYLLTKQGCEMVSNKLTGAKGVQFTAKYVSRFNEMENHIKQQLPTTFAEALRLAADLEEDKLLLEQKVAEYEPKINYLDMILGSTDTVTISQIAADYGMSAYQMNKSLNKLGVQHKVGGQWILYKKHMRQGYVKSHTTEIPKSGGGTKTVMNTKWTQKGRLFIYELLKEGDIYPVMDLEETA